MRRLLLDAGVLIRFAYALDPLGPRVAARVRGLAEDGWDLCFAPQAYRESLNALTRPIANGGYGLSSELAVQVLQSVETSFTLLPENPDVFRVWQGLVAEYGIVGKSVHDANVVATALAHGATHLLTLNERDFRRYAGVETLST